MTPAQRVALDRAISDEQFDELHDHGTEPTILTRYFNGMQPIAVVLYEDGSRSPRAPLDECRWTGAVALKLQWPNGNAIDAASLMSDDDDGWDYQ